jgi:hypothetical protein
MKTLVLVFIGMTSAFLAESCQGNPTQGQQSVLKITKSTVEVHSVWHNILLRQTGRCGLLCITPCAWAKTNAKERGTDKYYHSNFLRE